MVPVPTKLKLLLSTHFRTLKPKLIIFQCSFHVNSSEMAEVYYNQIISVLFLYFLNHILHENEVKI